MKNVLRNNKLVFDLYLREKCLKRFPLILLNSQKIAIKSCNITLQTTFHKSNSKKKWFDYQVFIYYDTTIECKFLQ